jgi:hypothetical protein
MLKRLTVHSLTEQLQQMRQFSFTSSVVRAGALLNMQR